MRDSIVLCPGNSEGIPSGINNQGHGEARGRLKFRPRFSSGVFPMAAPAIPSPAPKGRLGNGQLRRQVTEWLAARPGSHTVGEVAKDLGRSAGAVGNALITLADQAEAARIAGKLLRYEANSATAAAAAAIAPRPPSPPLAPQASRAIQGRPCRAEASHPASPARPPPARERPRPHPITALR
jgi:hypothetical protein